MRAIRVLIFPIILTLLLAACGGGEEAVPTAAPASPPPPASAPAPQPPSGDGAAAAPSGTVSQPAGEGTQVTIINGDPAGPTKAYKFVPSELNFKVGETVTITVRSETELHNLSIDALEIDQDVDGGKDAKVTFTFQEAGTYRFYCLFHEANGMEGTITVE